MTMLLKILSAFAAVFAVLFACPARAEGDQRPSAYVFVIDATNSMTSKLKGVVKLDMAKAAFAKSLPSAPRQAVAALLSFGDQPARACEDVVDLVPPTPADKSAGPIRNAFSKLEPKTSGKTPILAAAARAAQIIEARGKGASGAVIVVTDGGDDCSPRACERAQSFHAQHPAVTVHIVSLRPDRLIGAQLQCIAAGTGGLFAEAQKEQQLTQAVTAALRHVPAPPPAPEPQSPAQVAQPPALPSPAVSTPATTPSPPTASAPASTPPETTSPAPAPAAPSAPDPAVTASAKQGPAPNVTLRATLAQGSPPLTQGVGWRVFASRPDAGKDNGKEKDRDKALWSGAGAEAHLRLAPGVYYAEAAFGLIKAGSSVTVPADGHLDAVIPLNAGAINVRAVGRAGGPALDHMFYRLYGEAPDSPSAPPVEVGRSSLAQAVFYVPAGRYRIVAEHGSAKAELPVAVTPGGSFALDMPMNAGALKLGTSTDAALPQAAAGPAAATPPQFFYQVYALEDGKPNGAGATPAKAEPGREIARSSEAEPTFDLPQGSYRVAVHYDWAVAEKDVKVAAGEETREVFNLDVGGITMSSRIAGKSGPESGAVTHVVYRLSANPGGEAVEVGRAPNIGRVYQLNTGAYRVVSQFGRHNARETTEVTIKAGEIQKLEFELHFGEVRLALGGKGARRSGKQPVAWTLKDASGREVLHSEDREPELTLKSGSYTAEARSGIKTFAATFEVGDNEKKKVVAAAQ